ncbi:MAG TPA: O-antigen ligase family protein [Pyrinomonadaceae bacterium]|nr:O-antigen ligase family protein [Pyrinomonadaceae bacterium]
MPTKKNEGEGVKGEYGSPPPSAAAWLDRGVTACLFLLALFAPHSIAGTQGAWLLGTTLWAARFLFRPRPVLRRTPVDYALLGFFVLTFFSALTSYDPDLSIGKLRAASLFTIVYVVAQNVRSRRVLRALVVTLVASCTVNVAYTFAAYAAGRGVKLDAMAAESPLRAAGLIEGDTLLSADGVQIEEPADLVRALEAREGGRPVRVRLYRVELLPETELRRESLLAGATPEARLGIVKWSYGRDQRASGFFGHYTTYAEALQLIGSLALGLLVALRRKWSLKGALLTVALAGMCGALILTVTRATWLGFLLSALSVALVGASRRALAVTAALALPLAAAGLFVLQQKRQVGFIDTKEGSTAWRLMVYREAFEVLAREPRHLLVGVGMDTLKRRWREWGMFDEGRQPWGHLHSTPLQIAFERGLPALLAWAALLFLYGRALWRLARTDAADDWVLRGLALGALGGLVGFVTSGTVHYNFGDSEVVEIFYFIMGLALAAELLARRCGRRARGLAIARSLSRGRKSG